jgi:hypothetical protein
MNISHRGWLRFVQSDEKGEAGEAMVQESNKEVVILKVDASKLSRLWGDKLLTRFLIHPTKTVQNHNMIL